MQRSSGLEGVDIRLLSVSDLETMLPETDLTGIVGVPCPHEGAGSRVRAGTAICTKSRRWALPSSNDEVVDIKMNGDKIVNVVCKVRHEYSAGAYVNAAGPWANLIGDMIGVEIPIKASVP